MNRQSQTQMAQSAQSTLPHTGGLLQRKCACGNHTMAGGECQECGKKRQFGLQTKLQVNEPGDVYEQEADRIADQVMATPAHPAVSVEPPRIQRLVGQPTRQSEAAPTSADLALSAPGRPLEPALRQDMEQRFGYDFSRVRVHVDDRASESADALGANAYTLGQQVVFGRDRFDPVSGTGRRLIAHELAHTIQQRGSGNKPRGKALAPEREADRAASQALDSSAVPPLTPSPLAVACQRSDDIAQSIELIDWQILLVKRQLQMPMLLPPLKWQFTARLQALEMRRIQLLSGGAHRGSSTRPSSTKTGADLASDPAEPPVRICVPTIAPDDPACVEWFKRKEQLKLSEQQPGRSISITAPDAPVPAGLGLQVPAHPDAISGIHDWTIVYGAPNRATSHNKFDVGTFRLVQVCTFDETGAPRVYVYYVYDTDSDDKYAVGPNAVMRFVTLHGGRITAHARNTDQLESGQSVVDPRKLPAAPDAFKEEPTIYYAAPQLPGYDEVGTTFHIGKYSMQAYLRRLPNGSMAVLYYIAKNILSKFRPEYVVGPAWLNVFTERQGGFSFIAEFSHPIVEPGAMPPEYAIHSARFLQGVRHGDPERARSGIEAWKSAVKDPSWWFQVGMGYAGAAQPLRSVRTPSLKILPGGGSRIPVPAAVESITAPVVSPPQVTVPTGGTARAAVAAAEPLPITRPVPTPVTTSHPRPQGVPGWNPTPAPVARRVNPPSPIVAGVTIGALPVPVPAPNPKHQQQRRKCQYPTGLTPDDPIPIQWFKPRLDRFYPKTVEIQNHVYDRDAGESHLPRGEPFGVSEARWPAMGKKVRLKYWDRPNRAESDRYRDILRGYGYRASRRGLQVDHVQDPQWGLLNADLSGAELDVWSNLWPLSQDLNASAGGRQNNTQLVTYCEGPYGQPRVDVPVAQVKAEGRYGLHFVIRRVNF